MAHSDLSEIPVKSMKLSKEDIKENESIAMDSPKYPYGLSLELSDDVLEKLGATKLPAVGEVVELHAFATVTSINENDSAESGKNRNVSLQIVELGVAPYKKSKDASTVLYGGA